MRVLVTGNLGYVGTVMTPLLQGEGHEVWGFDTGYFADCVLGELGDSGLSRQILRDVREVEPADLSGVDAVVHLAGLSNDPTGELNPQLTEQINLEATVRLAEASKRAGVTRFLFASSCSIYGQGRGESLTEEDAFQPLTAYARSKVGAEAALHEMADATFSPVYLRNATAYGFSPRLRFDIVVNNLTGWAMTTREVRLLSDGRAWRAACARRGHVSRPSRQPSVFRASDFTTLRSTWDAKRTTSRSATSPRPWPGSCRTAV